MAAPAISSSKHMIDEPGLPTRKRFKTSELPLNSAQRSSVDGLLHTIKKKGEYDALRKQVWSQFAESEEKIAFTKSLHELAEAEIDRDPSLLSRERGKAATLMQGAVDRSDIYKTVEKSLDDLIGKNIDNIIKAGREIRKVEVGEAAAAEEERRGGKTDEEYAQEIAVKRKERVRLRKQEETRKRREDEKDALRAEEAKKMKELADLRYQDEKRKEREALRASRDAVKKKPRDMTKEELEWEKENARNKLGSQDHATEYPITPAPPIDEKAFEEAALALLLQEGREAAAKNAPKVERERSESPHRKPHISPPKGPAAMRARDPTKPKLGFSSTPIHQDSPVPPPPLSARSGSRSPYHVSSSRRERSRSPSRTRRRSHSTWDEEPHRESQSDAQAAYKAQMRAKHDAEAEAHKGREDEDVYEPSNSRARERDSTRDRDDRSRRYDYDHKYSRESYHRRDDRSRSRDRESTRYEDRRSSYGRGPREEAPDHIDRYVPGGAKPRDRDNRDNRENRENRDRARERDRDRERDPKDRDSRDSRRERGSYYDTDRERHYYKKENDSSRSEYRERDRGSDRTYHRDRESYRERDRDRRDDRPHRPIRTDDPPEHIDRYVPGK